MTSPVLDLLVVDDDPVVLGLVELRLSMSHRVTASGDAWQQIASAEQAKVDLIVSDIQMPGCSGLDAYKMLRTSERSRSVPVIFMTGMDLGRARKLFPEDPLVRFVHKPIDFVLLRALIKELTGADGPI